MIHTRFIYGTHKVCSISQYGQNIIFIFYSYEKLILLYKIYIFHNMILYMLYNDSSRYMKGI